MAHLALSSSALGGMARAGPCRGHAAPHGTSTPFGGLGTRPLVPGAAPVSSRRTVAASAWWQLKSPFGSKTETSEGSIKAGKRSQDTASTAHTSFDAPPEGQPAAAASPQAPAATSFAAPAAAREASPAAAPASPGGKVSRKKKKAGKGRRAAEAPAATSFNAPKPAAAAAAAEVAPPAAGAAPAAPKELVFPANNDTTSNSGTVGISTFGNGSGSAPPAGPQVINLANASLKVNPDGSVSISGEDAQRVLQALSAVGVLPAAAAASGAPAVGNGASVTPALVRDATEIEYLTARSKTVQEHFETAIGADDFMQRVEMALYSFGFSGDNCIAMVNLCRDEVTVTLKQKIDAIFGASFSTNGLGGVLTCGTIGMGAGFSHSPVCSTTGKERYVFFSFPHISINSRGEVGPMSRPGRPGQSCACGALIKSWNDIRADGLTASCKIPGVHDAVNPEYSILKQRIARRLRHEGETDESVKEMSLVELTHVAERTISDDLEFLISKTVDTSKADYAVITGVQIHNWAYNFEDDSPSVEFVAPTSAYVVVDGVKTHIDLLNMPPLTPRQIRLLHGGNQQAVCNTGGQSTLREEDAPYAYDNKDKRKAQRRRLERYVSLMREEGLEGLAEVPAAPTWQSRIVLDTPARCAVADNSTIIDRESASKAAVELKELQTLLQQKYKDQQRTA